MKLKFLIFLRNTLIVCRTVIFAIYKNFCIGLNLELLDCVCNLQNLNKVKNYSLKSNFKNELGLHKSPSAANSVMC